MSDSTTDYDDRPDSPSLRPWIRLQTTYDVEAWIDNYNRELQRSAGKANAAGYGICFHLAHGGELFLHTTPEGEVLLDVRPEAAWVGPLIAAAAQVEPPAGTLWRLPPDRLTQLIFGLSGLIEATSIVLEHDFRARR